MGSGKTYYIVTERYIEYTVEETELQVPLLESRDYLADYLTKML